jgi:predicted RNase H-like nuclease
LLKLDISERFGEWFDEDRIAHLKGAALKHNEDALDSVVCLYVCALYALGVSCRTFGDLESGYIVVPSERCR